MPEHHGVLGIASAHGAAIGAKAPYSNGNHADVAESNDIKPTSTARRCHLLDRLSSMSLPRLIMVLALLTEYSHGIKPASRAGAN